MTTRVTQSATVPVPLSRVWETLANHEAMATWAPGLQVVLDTEGSPARNGVGAVRRITAPGPAPAIVEEIVAFEPNRKLGYRAISGVPFKNYSGEVVLSADGEGTKIDYSLSIDERVPVADKVAATALCRVLLSALVRASKK